MKQLEVTAGLLGVDSPGLADALTKRLLETTRGGQVSRINASLSAPQASGTRDALAKTLYSRLFDFLVGETNKAMGHTGLGMSIGILDIYGFEVFEKNGFEQFCINYVNERLQQIFIELTLRREQEEYEKEGIEWKAIDFFNNQAICDLMDSKRPPGLFALLDDACRTLHHDMSTADVGFRDKCSGQHGAHKHYFGNGKGFVLKHYAGEVQYDVAQFAEKNRDVLVPELVMIMQSSSSKFIPHMFPEEIEVGGQRKAPPTAGSQMVKSCSELVKALMKCQPHYIRCIKPNDSKAAGSFEKPRCQHQVKYLGLQENIRVRRAGYAYRATFKRFLERFYLVSPHTFYIRKWRKGEEKGCLSILKAAGMGKGDFQMGRSKVFIRQPETLFALEELRDQVFAACAIKIQRAYRSRKQREYSIKLRSRFNDMICGQKERRRMSVFAPYVGDYLHYREDSRLLEIMGFDPIEEAVLFTSGVTRYSLPETDRKAESRACKAPDMNESDDLKERCLLVVTDARIYLVQSPQNGMRCLMRIPMKALDKCSMSRNADNCVNFHVNTAAKGPLKKVAWKPDKDVKACVGPCKKNFGWFKRRHHCRACGQVFCSSCTMFIPILPDIAQEGKSVKEGERVCAECELNVTRQPLADLLISCDRKTELVAILMDAIAKATQKDPDWLVEFVDDSVKLRKAGGGSYPVTFRKDESCRSKEDLPKEKVTQEGGGLCIKVASGIPAHLEKERRERERVRIKELARKRKKQAKKRAAALEAQRADEEAEAIERRRIKFAEREAAAAAAPDAVDEVTEDMEKVMLKKKKRESRKKAKEEEAAAAVPEWQKRALKRAQ